MGLIIYSKSITSNVRGGSTFSYRGEFAGRAQTDRIVSILESDAVAEALGVGTHELIVGFATHPGAPANDGPMQWLTREWVKVERAEAPLRVTSVEALI